MMKILKNRNSGFQKNSPPEHDSNQFIQTYTCLKRTGDDTATCSDDMECESGVCDPEKKYCVHLDNDKPCFQNWQCKSGACIAYPEPQED